MRRTYPPAALVALVALAACAALFAALVLTACGSATSVDPAAPEPEADTPLRVAALKGPTAMGLAPLMADTPTLTDGQAAYTFTLEGTADALVPALVKGDIDIALIPANLAAVLYGRTEGGIRVIDINTLGVLYGVTARGDVFGAADLAGKTVCITGAGTVPQYTVEALLAAAGVAPAALEFKSEPAEVVAALAADPAAVGILPQPFATAALSKVPGLHTAFSVNDEWAALMGSAAGAPVTGVTVVRTRVLAEHPAAVATFLADHAASVAAANADPAAAAPAIVAAGILDSEALAAAALPACNLVCITGEDMQTQLEGFLQVLFAADSASVGGALPGEDFYAVTAGEVSGE